MLVRMIILQLGLLIVVVVAVVDVVAVVFVVVCCWYCSYCSLFCVMVFGYQNQFVDVGTYVFNVFLLSLSLLSYIYFITAVRYCHGNG